MAQFAQDYVKELENEHGRRKLLSVRNDFAVHPDRYPRNSRSIDPVGMRHTRHSREAIRERAAAAEAIKDDGIEATRMSNAWSRDLRCAAVVHHTMNRKSQWKCACTARGQTRA